MINKAQQRNLSVTKKHNEDVQKLLKLMGVPVVFAPCEAEAQCAELCKKKKVFATATEDMDALTFATPILLRNLTYSESRKLDVFEIHYEKILSELKLKPRQFVDLCILCGCDYSPSIKGIGPKSALKLIREHESLEAVLKSLENTKYNVPKELSENVDEIRRMFEDPEVDDGSKFDKFEWKKPDEDSLKQFLVIEKQFAEDRVVNGLKRLEQSKKQTSQRRMDSFFKPKDGGGAFKRKKTNNKKQAKGKKLKK